MDWETLKELVASIVLVVGCAFWYTLGLYLFDPMLGGP